MASRQSCGVVSAGPRRHHLRGAQRLEAIQRGGPVGQVGVAGVDAGVELDQVARETDALRRNPDHAVAARVAIAQMHHAHLQRAQPDRQLAFEHEGGPGQAGDRFGRAEQARKTADLRVHVGLAALDDQLVGATAGDDGGRAFGGEGGRAQHAHRVVVRQGDMADRLVGDAANRADQVLRHGRRGRGVDHHHAVVADDDARIRIAVGDVGIGVVRQALERDFLSARSAWDAKGLLMGFPCEERNRGQPAWRAWLLVPLWPGRRPAALSRVQAASSSCAARRLSAT